MSEENKVRTSTLSTKRILISLLIYALTPVIYRLTNHFVHNDTISYTMAFNFVAWLLLIYDWNLFGVHWNRLRQNLGDGILYTFVGIVLIGSLLYVNQKFLKGLAILPDTKTLNDYVFAFIPMLTAFSFCQGLIINVSFKCLTDHMDIRSREVLLILFSGLLFGLIYTVSFAQFNVIDFVETFLYNAILVCILSYLYNQSNSFLPGILAYTVVMAVTTIMFLVR